jgi:hypothetical protein
MDNEVYTQNLNNDGETCILTFHLDDRGVSAYHSKDDLPAYVVKDKNGIVITEKWYKYGRFHRENGKPAYISKESILNDHSTIWRYYLHGMEYAKIDYDEVIQLSKTLTRDTAILHIKHESEFIRKKCKEILNKPLP